MQWDDLRVFLAVARAGQIARAAPTIGVDATTIGRRLRRLEKALGQMLFEQARDGQKLTEAGEALLARAEGIERMAGEIGQGSAAEPSGTVRVSASEGFGTWFVAYHLGDFATANPGVRADLVANSGLLNPSKREADVAILLARPRKGPLLTRKLADYRLRLYASCAYRDAHPPVTSVADLRNHRMIGYIPDLIYAPELNYLDELGSGLAPQLRSSSINAQYRMTAAGAGIAVLPCFIGDSDPLLTRLLPDFSLLRAFWLVTHRDTRDLPRIRRFVDWLTATTAERSDRLLGS